MNTRSCLLTVGVSALLATGSVLTAAPASAAPSSAECVAAQTALSTQLGIASVDISLANQLREAMASLDAVGAQLEPLYAAAELDVQDELDALDRAVNAEVEAWDRLEDANDALAAVDPADIAAVEAAQKEQQDAEDAYNLANEELAKANAAYTLAADAAYTAPEIVALEAQADAAFASFDDAFTRLGLTEGSDPEQLTVLVDAALAACSAPAVVQTPVVEHLPAERVAAPRQRGLNIQTAAHDAGATAPADIALLAGLAAVGAAAAAGSVVVVRRRSAGRA